MIKRILVGVLGTVVVVVGGALAFLTLRQPQMRPAPSIQVERTPERLARGKFLFSTEGCNDCHSETDKTRFGLPPVEGGMGKGQVIPDAPGTLSAPNLTSDAETGVGKFTDGELIRAIREGIGQDGRVLFPMMPYTEFRALSDEDVYSLVTYIRTLPPIRNQLPKTSVMFPVNLLIKSVPQIVETVPSVDKTDTRKYGAYLVKIQGCYFCHTPVDNHEPIKGKEFSGGQVFELAKGVRAVSANLTPDTETGLGKWTEDQFLAKFAEYKDYAANGPPKIDPAHNTVMPWLGLSQAAPEDLKAIFAHLRSVPAIHNAVTTHPDAPEEKKK